MEGPGFRFSTLADTNCISYDESSLCLCLGNIRFDEAKAQAMVAANQDADAWRYLLDLKGTDAYQYAHGDFVVVYLNRLNMRLFAAVDRFAVHPLCFEHSRKAIALASRADEVPGTSSELDPQALFSYFYHHMIPAPRTVFRAVTRLAAAHHLTANAQTLTTQRHWTPSFVSTSIPFDERRDLFLAAVRDSVSHQIEGEQSVGSYLSGGTDSSTVTGMACQILNRPIKTFSMGFDATGYDEMQYARIAAKHFGAEHHEYYVTPTDLVSAIPDVARFYDQPFGNSSALPSYYCARLAHQEGITKMLAGDGGDELFGGNSRYVFNQLFAPYERLPLAFRKSFLEPAAFGAPLLRRLPLIRKVIRYLEIANLTPPQRNELYNLLTQIGPDKVVTQDFLARVDPSEPASEQARVYDQVVDGNSFDRLLAYEWKYVLADNDLPKVTGTGAMSSVRVGFPFLDDQLLNIALQLPVALRVKGRALRVFFKDALRAFLPIEIIEKTKHGFGLPFGVWLTQNEDLKKLSRDAIGSLVARKLVHPQLERMIFEERLTQHAGYYGELVWIMAMLEHWLRAHAPNARF